MKKLYVNDAEIQIFQIDEEDYISLSDMVRNVENGLAMIEKWLFDADRVNQTAGFCCICFRSGCT